MCDFVFKPNLWPGGSERLAASQECIYPSIPNSQYCAFHTSFPTLSKYISSREELDMLYRYTIAQVGRIELFCASIPYLDFQKLKPYVNLDQPINIGYSTFGSGIDLSGLTIQGSITLAECHIPELSMENSRIYGDINTWDSNLLVADFDNAVISGDAQFENTLFGLSRFVNTEFKSTVSFCSEEPKEATIPEASELIGEKAAEFLVTPHFLGTEFKNIAIFAGVHFHEGAVFSEATFEMGSSFKRIKVGVGVNFSSTEFNGKVDFGEAELGYAGFASARFDDIALFQNTTFGGLLPIQHAAPISNHADAEGIKYGSEYLRRCKSANNDHFMSFLGLKLEGLSATFGGVKFDTRFYFENCTANSAIDMSHTDLDYASIGVRILRHRVDAVGLNSSSIRKGTIEIIDEKSTYQLEKATLGSVNLESPDGINPFDHLYIGDTKFDQFDFSDYRASLIKTDWIIDGVKSRDGHTEYVKRETTYSKAKSGASQQGDTFAESNFFILERRFRRQRYLEEISNSNDYFEKIRYSNKAIANLLYDFTCVYGEKPGRVLSLSVLSIMSFGLIYAILLENFSLENISSLHLNWSAIIEYLIFSLQSFSSFLTPGSVEANSQLIRLIASFEAFLGAFAIGLFVATLVRSVKR